jgi:hypothetical protein
VRAHSGCCDPAVELASARMALVRGMGGVDVGHYNAPVFAEASFRYTGSLVCPGWVRFVCVCDVACTQDTAVAMHACRDAPGVCAGCGSRHLID